MHISEATSSDFDSIVELFHDYNFALKKREWFDWKLQQNPCGKSFILKAEENRKIVAVLSLMPELYFYKGECITALQATDGLIIPEMRGGKLFSKLMSAIINFRPPNMLGKYFYIGFPSLEKSKKAFESAGWDLLSDCYMKKYILHSEKFRSLPLGNILSMGFVIPCSFYRDTLFNAGKGFIVKELIQNSFDWDEFRLKDQVSGTRSLSFLDWRLNNNPLHKMDVYEISWKDEIAGYVISKENNGDHEVYEWRFHFSCKKCIAAYLRYLYETKRAMAVNFRWFGTLAAHENLPSLGIPSTKTSGCVYVKGLAEAGLPSNISRWQISYLDSDW